MKDFITNNKYIKNILVLLFWGFLWEMGSVLLNKALLLPPLSKIMKRLFQLIGQKFFWNSIGNSFSKIALGFFIALVIGVFLGGLAWYKKSIYDFLTPPFAMMKATPVASFTILLLVWIKSSQLSTFTTGIMVLPMFFFSTYTGCESVSQSHLEVAQVFQFSTIKKIKIIYLPTLRPFIIGTARTAFAFGWKAGIASEVIGLPNNTIGMALYNAKVTLETVDLFAWTVAVVGISYILEKIVVYSFGKDKFCVTK